MFVANVIVNNIIIDRRVFLEKRNAVDYAKRNINEKIWKIDDFVYFGDVNINVYDMSMNKSSDYMDVPFISL